MRIIKSEREYVHDASSISFYEKKIKSDDEKKLNAQKSMIRLNIQIETD